MSLYRGGGSSRWSAARPRSPIFGLTCLKERRYVAGVLRRRLLRSFPGAHGCQNPNLELNASRKENGKMVTKVSKKPPLLSRQKRHSGRLGWLGDASRATCEPPSWGSDAERAGGHRVPPRSGAEGRVRAAGGRGRVAARWDSVSVRKWADGGSSNTDGWSPNPRMLVCPNMGHLWAVSNGNYYVTRKAAEWQLLEHLCTPSSPMQ